MSTDQLPITKDDERRWREVLDNLGPDLVQLRLLGAISESGGQRIVPGIMRANPAPSEAFVENWLSDRQTAIGRRDAARYWRGLAIAVLTLIAAVIAAWAALFKSH
jgi:hypothetical protein